MEKSLAVRLGCELETKNSCTNTKIGNLLDDYVGGHLSKEETEDFDDHLSQCHFCDEEFWKEIKIRGLILSQKVASQGNLTQVVHQTRG